MTVTNDGGADGDRFPNRNWRCDCHRPFDPDCASGYDYWKDYDSVPGSVARDDDENDVDDLPLRGDGAAGVGPTRPNDLLGLPFHRPTRSHLPAW